MDRARNYHFVLKLYHDSYWYFHFKFKISGFLLNLISLIFVFPFPSVSCFLSCWLALIKDVQGKRFQNLSTAEHNAAFFPTWIIDLDDGKGNLNFKNYNWNDCVWVLSCRFSFREAKVSGTLILLSSDYLKGLMGKPDFIFPTSSQKWLHQSQGDPLASGEARLQIDLMFGVVWSLTTDHHALYLQSHSWSYEVLKSFLDVQSYQCEVWGGGH